MSHKIKDIFKKGNSEKAGIEEKQEMLSLFHKQYDEFELKSILFNELENTAVEDDSVSDLTNMFPVLWQKISKRCDNKPSSLRWLYPALKVAAALIIGLIIGVYVTSIFNREEPVVYTAHSPLGSVSEWKLPDGSVIFLNAGSEIRYSTENKGPRKVYLTGEAWFDVASDPKRPFIVSTNYYDINVKGTKFNVKAYENDREVITTLEDGEIILTSSGYVRFEEDIILKPGEQAVLNKENQELSLRSVNTRWFTSWKENKLIFMNMDLQDLIVLIERKYGVDIVVKDPDILSYHCDGTFKNETIIEVLEIIKKTLPIRYEIVGQQIEITSK